MNIWIRVFALLLITNLVLKAAPKRPGWVDSPPLAPHLYQGIGVADDSGSAEEDRLRADQNARTDIIQEISSTISSEISSYYSESSHSGAVDSDENMEVFTSLSSAYADATIEGIQIVDRFHDKKNKIYYSYATLSRADFQSQMSRKAIEARVYAEERYKYAQAALQQGQISAALNHLSEALSHILVVQSIVKKHLVGDVDSDGVTEFLDAKFSYEINTIINRVNFVKLSGDGQKGERDQALFGPLKGKLIYEQEGSQIPLSNTLLSVTIHGAEADFTPTIATNKSGEFSARIDKLISASTPTPRVNIKFNFPELNVYLSAPGSNESIILPVGLQFDFSMDVAASVKVFVRVLEEINGERQTRSKSEGELIKALVGQKYKVIDAMRVSRDIPTEDLDFSLYYEEFETLSQKLLPHAEYAIVGVISSETSSTGTLNYASATAKLNVIDLKSGRIVSSGNQSGLKAAGNTEEKANISALKKGSNAAIAEILTGLEKALH
ncbi:MAG: LPP20 family lipoprotein [Candidatus Marinimicrobia bacterium]|nr:LPP20 family lipoprotein [Candidatus Neomarinimicrobiota bacterium]